VAGVAAAANAAAHDGVSGERRAKPAQMFRSICERTRNGKLLMSKWGAARSSTRWTHPISFPKYRQKSIRGMPRDPCTQQRDFNRAKKSSGGYK